MVACEIVPFADQDGAQSRLWIRKLFAASCEHCCKITADKQANNHPWADKVRGIKRGQGIFRKRKAPCGDGCIKHFVGQGIVSWQLMNLPLVSKEMCGVQEDFCDGIPHAGQCGNVPGRFQELAAQRRGLGQSDAYWRVPLRGLFCAKRRRKKRGAGDFRLRVFRFFVPARRAS